MAKKIEQNNPVDINETLTQSEAFFNKYKKAIIIAVLAIIVIIAGVMLWNHYVTKPHEEEASTVLAKAQQYFDMQQYDKALKGDGATCTGFLKVASDYSGTEAGNLANLYAGLCYAHQEKPDWKKALQYLKECDMPTKSLIGATGLNALAHAYANNDQLDDAVKTFKKVAEVANDMAEDGVNNSISPRALMEAGIILEKQGKKQEALAIYENIKKTYVASPVYQEIDKYIEAAKN